tara:strand:- start:399 stop:2252 length:1854 start_codon:yes stop_codon:yes gene_type:complete
MPLPFSPNSISLKNVELEHGGSPPISLSEYYGKSGAPSSGTISMNDFRQTGGAPPAATTSGLQCELDARNSSSWPGSGSTLYDTTSNSRDWTLINGPTGGTNSVVFDGSNDYAQISDAAWLPENNGPWTIEFMVKIHDFTHGSFNTSVRFLYSKSQPSNQACSVGFLTTSSTQLYMIANSQGGGNVTDSTHRYDMGNPSNWVNTWIHVMWTHTGNNGTLTYYINNSQVASWTGRTFRDNGAVARLMAFDPSNGNWGAWVDGEIRVARFYNKVLSSSERTANYNNAQSSSQAVVASVLSFSPSSHAGTQFTGTFDFDVDVADFAANDITISGGTKGSLTSVSASQYTMPITPSGNNTVTVTVPSSATFNAGNLGNNALSQSLSYAVYNYVTTNIAIDVDAFNSSSYGGSGSTWASLDSSARDLTLANSPTHVSTSPGYFDLDAADDYAYDSGGFNATGSVDYSLEVWFRIGSADGCILAGANNTNTGTIYNYDRHMYVGTNNRIIFGQWTNSHSVVSNSSNVADNTWRQAVGTYDGTYLRLYINGSQVASSTANNSVDNGTRYWTVGGGRNSSWPSANGSSRHYSAADISIVRIYWGTALSANDVTANFNTNKSRFGL